jgi:hypothetical protein
MRAALRYLRRISEVLSGGTLDAQSDVGWIALSCNGSRSIPTSTKRQRIRRLWRNQGLQVPQRRKKKRLTGIGVAVGAMSAIRPT